MRRMTDVTWSRLTRHLKRDRRDRVEMSLERLERVVGGPLPPAATAPGFWMNSTARAEAWRSAGFRVTRRGVPAGWVAFVREADLRPVPSPASAASAGQSAQTHDPAAEWLVQHDAFAFLLGVLFDHGIPAERAWRAPWLLQQRLGHLDPARLAADPESVAAAVATPPGLHRYHSTMAAWVVSAAAIVVDRYAGDASAMWADGATTAEVTERMTSLPGIGPTKAARAVALLQSYLGVPMSSELAADEPAAG
jgi:uncharacterized HhH-GPD family protein